MTRKIPNCGTTECKHGVAVCEPCAYDRGFRRGFCEAIRDAKRVADNYDVGNTDIDKTVRKIVSDIDSLLGVK